MVLHPESNDRSGHATYYGGEECNNDPIWYLHSYRELMRFSHSRRPNSPMVMAMAEMMAFMQVVGRR